MDSEEEEKENGLPLSLKSGRNRRKLLKKASSKNNNEGDVEVSSNGIEGDNFAQNIGKYSNTNTLVNFFNSYTMFVNEASNIILDLDIVLNKFVDAVKRLKPPTK